MSPVNGPDEKWQWLRIFNSLSRLCDSYDQISGHEIGSCELIQNCVGCEYYTGTGYIKTKNQKWKYAA